MKEVSRRWLVPLLVVLLFLASAASLLAGAQWLTPLEALSAVLPGRPSVVSLIVTDIRLPRLILSVLIGGILGLTGGCLQGLLRNPLAEPSLLGVSGGASFGSVIAIYFGLAGGFALIVPLASLAGAFVIAAIAFVLSRGGGTLALILAGSALSSIAGAGVVLALNLAPNPYAAYEIMTWLMGSLVDRSWDHVRLAGPFILVGGAVLLSTARSLDALSLGETQAESLGIDVARTRMIALVGTALGVGAATAVAGTISFVGLVAPHLVRPLVDHRPGRVLMPAALTGAVLVTLADIATRTIILGGMPLNLGVFTSIVGAPFFLWLVIHVRNRTP